MNSRILAFAFVLLLVLVSACSPAADTVTTTTAPGAPSSTETTTTTAPTTTAPPTTTLPAGTESLPEEMRREIAELVAITEELRGLTFLQPPTITVVTDEELEARVRESIESDIEDLPADEALLRLLGLIGPDLDLLQLYLDLYGEQVAGFYDGEVGELVVPAGDSLGAMQKATLVHELTHALTDQRFGFNDVYERLIDDQRFDEAVAFLAVIEGDATLTEILYIQRLDVSEQQELLVEMFSAESDVFDAAPAFLQNSLIFPYQYGLAFVQRAFEIGGFDEVNRLYVEPPRSSEQIYDPRAYQRDEPVPVTVAEPALTGYELIYDSVWGQLGFALMFDQVLGDDGPASGWGGDAYLQWFDGSNALLFVEYVGDTPADADELGGALVRYVEAAMAVGVSEPVGGGLAFEGDDYAFVRIDGDRVWFVAASDPAAGRAVVSALP
ncbi:MAG TPA: hypothetical protein VLB67_11895 [Acidimicrobiia bacterium]|nr:hypothetical protein [Acidimicrobiia bacterium]